LREFTFPHVSVPFIFLSPGVRYRTEERRIFCFHIHIRNSHKDRS
jgi:hypothetical protein